MIQLLARVTSRIPAHVYEGKSWAFFATTLSGLILCVFCATSLEAVGEAAHKTDAELTKEVIGTWEIVFARIGYSKEFLVLNANGTRRGIGITNDRGSLRHVESDGTWRVSHGFLIQH